MIAWLICAFGLLTAMAFAHRLTTIEAHLVEHLDRQVNSLKGVLVSTQDAINAVTDQLVKAQREIVSRIADVQAQLDAASVPAEVVDLSSLTAAAQRLDDIVADPEPTA